MIIKISFVYNKKDFYLQFIIYTLQRTPKSNLSNVKTPILHKPFLKLILTI